jgi:hypothetical protein
MSKKTYMILPFVLATLLLLFMSASPVFTSNSGSTDTNSVSSQATPEAAQLMTGLRAGIAPPANFDPLAASAAQLKEYGFPARPTNHARLSAWIDVMGHAKHYDIPKQAPSTAVHNQYGSTQYSSNLAGYVAQGSINGGEPYSDATAIRTQPGYSGSSDPSFWVGLGGFTTNDLVQAGADSNAIAAGGSTQYEFWLEDYPEGTVWEANPVLYSGDRVYVDVTYNGSNSTAYFEDYTTGHYSMVYFNAPYYDGSTADLINEAVGATYNNWTSWGITSFSQGSSVESNGYEVTLTSANDTMIDMTNNGTSSGTPETDTSSINDSTDGFTATAE